MGRPNVPVVLIILADVNCMEWKHLARGILIIMERRPGQKMDWNLEELGKKERVKIQKEVGLQGHKRGEPQAKKYLWRKVGEQRGDITLTKVELKVSKEHFVCIIDWCHER